MGCPPNSANCETGILAGPSDTCSLHSRQPVCPQGRIHRRPVSPFQAAYDKLGLPAGIAMASPNGFEKDSHCVIAFYHSDRVGCFHDGHVHGHASSPPGRSLAIYVNQIVVRVDGGQLKQIASLLINRKTDGSGPCKEKT
jgi:hypothetical protein